MTWRLLHITPHLGGGVGRALVNLAEGDRLLPAGAPERTVISLEPPQKTGAVDRLRALGVAVHTLADFAQLPAEAARHDVVQCEFWNHPLLFRALTALRNTPLRMIFWCHVSGLHFPRLPQALWQQPFPVALSAPCSLLSQDADLQAAHARGQVQVISSAGGFERWPRVPRPVAPGHTRLGYLGSLNPSKMHPRYVEWLAAAAPPGLRVEVLGDEVQPGLLAAWCRALRRPDLLNLPGFCDNVPHALAQWDAMVYLLNPQHYGTAELALLEAMASEVVPIVADNPCELDVVRHGDTGWVVRDTAGLAHALLRCQNDPDERQRMGRAASAWVRDTFTTARQAGAFREAHAALRDAPRQAVDWPALIGEQPWQWFRSTLPEPALFTPGDRPRLPAGDARHAHLERTKGSVHHFARCLPQDAQLQAWSRALDRRAPARLPAALAALMPAPALAA